MIFTVSARSENEIVMEENDKHLKFRTSLLMDGGQLYLTTLVRYNHWLGKLYFIPVKPFHRMLIKSQLKKTSAVIS
jgi:hypothetical protein